MNNQIFFYGFSAFIMPLFSKKTLHQKNINWHRAGLEPATFGYPGHCSYQLSYREISLLLPTELSRNFLVLKRCSLSECQCVLPVLTYVAKTWKLAMRLVYRFQVTQRARSLSRSVLEWRPQTGKRSVGCLAARWMDDLVRVAGGSWMRKPSDRAKQRRLEEAFVQQRTAGG